jgi:hypothetical protein
MKDFLNELFHGDTVVAMDYFQDKLEEVIQDKLDEMKCSIAHEMFEDFGVDYEVFREVISEANVQRMGRTKLIRVRVRGGKVQRRKKFSAVKGFTIRGGKMTRMSSQERLHRKMAARKSRFKRRAHLKQALRKRKISLRRRKAMGL